MVTIQIDFDQLLEAIQQLSDEQKQALNEYLVESGALSTEVMTPKKQRTLGLHPGAFQPSEDFNAPLPDEFWLGKA